MLRALAWSLVFIAGAMLGMLLVWSQFGAWKGAGFPSGLTARTPDHYFAMFLAVVGFLMFLVCTVCLYEELRLQRLRRKGSK